MNAGKYIFSQLVSFLPKRVFDGIVKRYEGDKWVKHFTCWNQLLVMMFGQLAGCDSLREVAAIIDAIKSKSYHLGFGSGDIKLSNLSYANANRDYKIFEELPPTYRQKATSFSTALRIKAFIVIPDSFARVAIWQCVSGDILTFKLPE